ncbi:MAG TPA: ABC transporter permease subunit [Kineosporiaceae bacterium]|nr:ABC transporter permease subunit [Kineosporiaceae bacterium]
MAVLELRQRVRSTRWIIVLAVWAAVLGGLAALIHYAVHSPFSDPSAADAAALDQRAGATMFGLVVLMVLALGALVAPALSATSVNGDRTAGVLATLQTTLLSPAEIAVGKLAAAWLTALALLAVSLPFIGWAYLEGGTPAGRLVVVLLLLAVMLLVVCAVGLGWSALTARTTSSAVLTYLTVAFLGLGLPVLFALLLPITRETAQVTVRTMEPIPSAVGTATSGPGATGTTGATPAPIGEPPVRCETHVQTSRIEHTERLWWVLAPNPAVVLADAAPRPSGISDGDVLSSLRNGVRELRLGQPAVQDYCYLSEAANAQQAADRQHQREALGVTWPYGLTVDLALGIGFTAIAVVRLRAPATRLARGTRVA